MNEKKRGVSAGGDRMRGIAVLLATVTIAVIPVTVSSQDREAPRNDVLAYHGAPSRSGNFVVAGLTWEKAKSVHPDETFRGRVAGNVYAQPLYAGGSRSGTLVVATEDNKVHALDGATGAEIWVRTLGKPVARSALRCGNINPLGITGTPVIDESREVVYLDAAIEDAGPHHRIFALSLKDGSPLPGWPIDVAEALHHRNKNFNARDQNQRGALTILDQRLYVPFGGHFGDCGDYHGWVVGVSLNDPREVTSWSTRGRGGGIWAPGGISVAGRSLFVATGNTFGTSTWRDGEAVIRLAPDLHRSDDTRDFFAPTDWHALDERDADLGGSNPVPLDVEGPAGPRAMILALGKDGKAYLLDRNNLGGIGGSLAVETVSRQPIRTAAAVYPVGGDTYVALQVRGARCPAQGADNELVVLKVSGGVRPALSIAWCGGVRGAGSPIVTTTDGRTNPIVWMVGAEGDNRLHGFKGDTGEPLFSAGAMPAMTGLRHFQTLIATSDRLFVGADGRVYAFAF
jgi:outer membrane protein assembly factor BamB